MSYILEQIINKRLSSIMESVDAKDPYAAGYSRQYAEDMLWHTVGPLTDDPKWINRPWSSSSPEPDDYTPGGQAYNWTPEEVVFAFAGNPSKLHVNSPDSPRSGNMGGSPMYRSAKKVAKKFGKSSDDDFIADLFSNGFVPLTKMMHKGFDEGREPFISYVIRSVIGAMESGPGADRASINVTAGGRSKEHLGLSAVLSTTDTTKIRKAADKVKGEYRTKRSHDKHPDNPYQSYSYAYHTTMHNYADALDSGDEDKIDAAKNQIRQLIDDIEDSNPTIRGAASGMGQAVSNKDRGAASGEARYLVKTLGLETIANSNRPDTFKKIQDRLDLINKNLGYLKDKIQKETEDEEKQRLIRYEDLIKKFVSTFMKGDENALIDIRIKIEDEIQKHKNAKKFGIASMDAQKNDETDSMGASMSSDEHHDNWLDPEAVSYILDIALNYDISSVLSKNSKWMKMASELGAKGGRLGGKLTVNELRYIIRSMGPLGSNYPGRDKVRSNISVPRDTKGWWEPGEDPEIEPIPSGGLWNSIWKRNGYNPMQPTAIAAEMTSEVIEFRKLGIKTSRVVQKKVGEDGKEKKTEAISKVAVANMFKSAKIKLQIIADIHKDELGIGESVDWVSKDTTDRMIISECASRMANKLNKSLILEALSFAYNNLLIEDSNTIKNR